MNRTRLYRLAVGGIVLLGSSTWLKEVWFVETPRTAQGELGTEGAGTGLSRVAGTEPVLAPVVPALSHVAQDDQIKHLASELQSLRERLLHQEKELSHQRAIVVRLSDRLNSLPDLTADDQTSDLQNSEPDEERIQNRFALFESVFASETLDPQWSNEAVDRITEVFAMEALKESLLINVGCASTLCRLEIGHRNEDSMNRFLDEFPTTLGWQTKLNIQVVDASDEGIATVVYLSRPGYTLPKLDR